MNTEPDQPTGSAPTPLSRTEVAARLDTLSYAARCTTADVWLDGQSVKELAESRGVTPSLIYYRVRQVTRAFGIDSVRAPEWQVWLSAFGDLLAPCLKPSASTPCPRIANVEWCTPCEDLAAANRAFLERR
ncbi:hypothetical protein [Kitasatospora griseola]